jgi:uncharacterized membrane protein required for colicin V production
MMAGISGGVVVASIAKFFYERSASHIREHLKPKN